ncbi:Hint domain-containing protein [Halosimplex aquaticum]|uniref:Hint domain-containing protein n=1 Tax=Halosimplex aquaticum TaxID=3026162 RepID=A0ABD5XZ00_9EURY|nr:Hint domain-containing protein [Halosimplex aquaticum]
MTRDDTERDRINASTTDSTRTIELSAGGFTPDTEVITATGPTRVSELSAGDYVYTLDPVTRLARLKPVTGVQRVTYDGDLVAVETNRCNIHVHPDHRMVCRTIGQDELAIRTAETIDDYEHYKLANEWRTISGDRLAEVDITDLLDDYEMCVEADVHGHTFRRRLPDGCDPVRRNGTVGYCFDPETFKTHQDAIESLPADVSIHAGLNHHRRPYRFDGDDFVEFLGWFIAEGSTTWPDSSDTVQVQIAQQDETHRQVIADLRVS